MDELPRVLELEFGTITSLGRRESTNTPASNFFAKFKYQSSDKRQLAYGNKPTWRGLSSL